MGKVKINYIDKIPKVKSKKLFYYDIRTDDIGNGPSIERMVIINREGSIVANKDLLKDNRSYDLNDLYEEWEVIEERGLM